jgi:hypothetical protein
MNVIAWLALVLAVLALAASGLVLLRLRLLVFRPEVLAGDVIVPRAGKSGSAARLLLPLQFSNSGYADGVVEWVALRLTLDGDMARSLLLSPVGEVDMQRFFHARRQVTEDNTLEPFTPFALEGRRSIAKFLLFDVAERPRAAPLRLQPGRYGFELFMKTSTSARPRLERSIEHVVEQKHIDDYRDDTAVYLINYQITLPAARRALAEQEWMPRTREVQSVH